MNTRERRSGQEIRTGRIQEAMARYCLGRDTMKRTADAAGATIRIGKAVLYDFSKLDQYMSGLAGGGSGGNISNH